MAQAQDSMVEPRIEVLLSKVDSRFTLVTLGALRARQINAYYGQLRNDTAGSPIPPQVTSVARKSLSIAFEEIAADKILPVDPPTVEELAEIEAAEAAAAADAAALDAEGDGD